MEWAFSIGTMVVSSMHTSDHRGWVGFVCAREFYEDFGGGGRYYYVRWMRPEGELNDEKMRLHERELSRSDP